MNRALQLLILSWACAVLAVHGDTQDHWAWKPISVVGDQSSVISVDHFIGKELDAKGLKMSPEAARRTLIRRLNFDLHGLPPAPEAVEAFVNDPDPKAYEKLVDRLLDSPHYGERYARHWLDIAHYADTHGFERDRRRPHAWPYRDYVIQAFNVDKPYDRFIREQIAGDVLWPDDAQAVIATGFLAAGPWDFVGQKETQSPVLRRSARNLDLDDMATQVMTSTMAMTVNCAMCHDHKLDPISQEEYYRFRAVFAGVKREERVNSAEALKRYEAEKKPLHQRRDEIAHAIGKLEGKGIDLADIVGGGNGHGTGAYRNAIDPRNAVVQTRNFGNLGNVKPNHFTASKFEFVDGVFVPDGDGGKAKIPVSTTGLTVTGLPKTSGQAWDMIRNGPVASQHSNVLGGIDFTKDGHTLLGLHANAGITFDLAAIRRVGGLKGLRFTAQLGYFGMVGDYRADARAFVDGEPVAEFVHLQRKDGLQQINITLPETARFLTLVSTDGENGYSHDQLGWGDAKLRADPPPDITPAGQERLAQLRKEKTEVEARLKVLGAPPKFYGVVAEKVMPEVRIQERGDPESPIGDPLAPGAFSVISMLDPKLGKLDAGESERRKALAEWITHADNPLTARVIVNRLWHWHFGQGIVNTPSDFGKGGDRPSHPELLDWLATELVRSDWSLKAMHRLILNSAAYKQDSRYAADATGVSVDAGNRLLWRQNSRRLEAEAIRDAVLFVSGKMNPERGGPGFEDFKYRDAYAPIYTYVIADEPRLWRRSIYRYIVRTTPDRFLTTLDCPDPANLTPVRMTTTTPLQSLALYNNDFMLRQARYFAERVEGEREITRAFELAFGRKPSKEEAKLAGRFVEEQGLFAFCRSLFNANEFVYVD